jgi:hypothetical protein
VARLSNATRDKMAAALVKHRFAAEAAELVAESQELFRKVYDHHHSADVQKHMAAIIKSHKAGFDKASRLKANVTGRDVPVGDESIGVGAINWKVEVAARPILEDANRYYGIGVDADSELGKALIAFSDKRQGFRNGIEPARREALGALAQFTTGKKLAEEWPEAMPVIGPLIPEDDRTLPVVQVAHLNSKFDLPPSERLAA